MKPYSAKLQNNSTVKFLKKDATEAGYITEIITKFIFAHPEISFKLIINGKEKLYSAGDNSLKNAVYVYKQYYDKDKAYSSIEGFSHLAWKHAHSLMVLPELYIKQLYD